MNLWAEVSFFAVCSPMFTKKLLNSSAISLILEFDFPFMINVSGMVGPYGGRPGYVPWLGSIVGIPRCDIDYK